MINPETNAEYTIDDKNFVDWILHLTCIYDGHFHVLSIDRNASDALIQKNFRKISLRLHPDRNKSPLAKQAYQALSLAKDVLLNQDYKLEYMAHQTYNPEHPSGNHPEYYDQPTKEPPALY